MSEPVYIKTTEDGRKVEVIGNAICLDGKPEAYDVVDLKYHPNKNAIVASVPNATHMAGRLPLSAEQASAVRSALAVNSNFQFTSKRNIDEYFRVTTMMKSKLDGIE